MSETYKQENEINEVDAQKDFDIKMILELKKLKWVLENEGYLPTIEEAMVRIARKWEVSDDWYSEENQDNIELRGLEADHADENLPAEDNDFIQ